MSDFKIIEGPGAENIEIIRQAKDMKKYKVAITFCYPELCPFPYTGTAVAESEKHLIDDLLIDIKKIDGTWIDIFFKEENQKELSHETFILKNNKFEKIRMTDCYAPQL